MNDDAARNTRWSRLQELFAQLLDVPAEQREAWLVRAEPDETLRREALALVRADSDAARVTGSFGAAVREAADVGVRANDRLGPYRLLHEIGAGGMGTVFLAQRADAEFDSRVAIKLIRGIATRDAEQRLRHERQILANLNHPHIARLLDGGTTDAGQPYLVMDFVDGQDIVHYCRSRAASLPVRLRLLAKVARAVHYAHQRLVVHRDLKPANVLVRADGEPVLLDFGIAKLLDGSQDPALTGAPWFTPGYASPEQLRGEPASTATDVHALGLLLYELIEQETPPSSRTQPLRLGAVARVDRDLGRIVAKATHPQAERRYASAEAFALDLERYLGGRPIEAAPDRVAYRGLKFVRRHPVSVAVCALALLCAAIAAAALVVQRDRALAAEQSAGAVRDFLLDLFRGADPEDTGGAKPDLFAILAAGAANARDNRTLSPTARAELLGALGTIYRNLGRFTESEQLLDASIAQWQAEDARVPARFAPRIARVELLTSIGKTRDAVREGETLLAELRGDAGTPPELLEAALDKLGEARVVAGMTAPPAEADAREAVALARRSSEALKLGLTLDTLAMIQNARDETVAAESSAAEAVRLLEQAGSRGRYALRAALLTHAGTLARENRHDEALARMTRSLELARSLYPPGHIYIARTLNTYGNELGAIGRLDEAQAALRESIAIQRRQFGDEHPRLAAALFNLAAIEESRGDYPGAAAQLEKALALQVREHGAEDEHAVQIDAALANVLAQAGDHERARERFAEVDRALTQTGVKSRSRARAAVRLARFRFDERQPEVAAQWLEPALSVLAAKAHVDTLLAQEAGLLRVELLAARGRTAEANIAWRAIVAELRAMPPAERFPACQNYLDGARIAIARGEDALARELLDDADGALAGRPPVARLARMRTDVAARLAR